ncbi:hypothetical protein M5D96_014145, partial [Drosophila gunungcola]
FRATNLQVFQYKWNKVSASSVSRPVTQEQLRPAESVELSSSQFPIHRGGCVLQHASALFKASGEFGLMWLAISDTASFRLATPNSGESTFGCWPICHRVCFGYWMHTDHKGAVAEGGGPAGYDKESWEQEALIQDVVEAGVLVTSKQPEPVAAEYPVKSARGKPVVELSAVLPSGESGLALPLFWAAADFGA